MLLSTGTTVAQCVGQTVNLALKTGTLLQQLLIVYKKL